MSLPVYLGFLLACVAVMVVPGPAVTLIVANGLRHGRRAGLLNVAGVQLGLALTLGVALLGLASLVAAMGMWFVWVRLAGAAYLVWLGCKMLMGSGGTEEGAAPRKPRGGFFVQGLIVSLSRPCGRAWRHYPGRAAAPSVVSSMASCLTGSPMAARIAFQSRQTRT